MYYATYIYMYIYIYVFYVYIYRHLQVFLCLCICVYILKTRQIVLHYLKLFYFSFDQGFLLNFLSYMLINVLLLKEKCFIFNTCLYWETLFEFFNWHWSFFCILSPSPCLLLIVVYYNSGVLQIGCLKKYMDDSEQRTKLLTLMQIHLWIIINIIFEVFCIILLIF